MQTFYTISKSRNVIIRARKNKHNYSLLLDIEYGGKRKHEYLNLYISTIDKKRFTAKDRDAIRTAEMIKSVRIQEIISGKYEFIKQAILNHEYILEFFSYLVNQKKENKSKSFHKWRSTFNHLKSYLVKDIKFINLTPSKIEGFKSYLLSKLKQNSVVTYMNVITTALNIAVQDGLMNFNPMDKVRKPRSHETPLKYLTINEIKLLNDSETNHPIIKNAFLFSCFTGLRLSDIENLTWKQISEDNGRFVLYLKQSKTGDPVMVYISTQALKYLGERRDGNSKVFELLNRRHTQVKLKSWIKSIEGINKDITFHSARHTFATLTLTYGAGLKTVSELLGHSTIRMTERYAKVVDKLKQDAIDNLPTL